VDSEGDGKGFYGGHSDYADEVSPLEGFLRDMWSWRSPCSPTVGLPMACGCRQAGTFSCLRAPQGTRKQARSPEVVKRHTRSCGIVNAHLARRHFGTYVTSLMEKVIEWSVLVPKTIEEGTSREQSGIVLPV